MHRLSAEVELSKLDIKGNRSITVGNTGLFLVEQSRVPGAWQLHFTPEGQTHKTVGKDQQYAITFLGALSALSEWFDQQETVSIRHLHICTNPDMARFITDKLGLAVCTTYETCFEVGLMIDWECLAKNALLSANLDSAYRQLVMNAYWVEGVEIS